MTDATHDDQPDADAPARREPDDDAREEGEDVDESSEMSFPASDPPAQGGTT